MFLNICISAILTLILLAFRYIGYHTIIFVIMSTLNNEADNNNNTIST